MNKETMNLKEIQKSFGGKEGRAEQCNYIIISKIKEVMKTTLSLKIVG